MSIPVPPPPPAPPSLVQRFRASLVIDYEKWHDGIGYDIELIHAASPAESFGGLTEVLDQVEAFHPPEVVDALWRGVLARTGDTAVHYAAMLLFLHGKATSAFDWDHRPFLLLFNTDDPAERRLHFAELCRRVGTDADALLARLG